MLTLFPTILLVCGKVNFTNLSRYSDLSEKTYRRQYSQAFKFPHLNAQMIQVVIPSTAVIIGTMDCSFVPKSGKKTYGLDWFYNGSASRSQKGLEISVIAVIDVTAHQGYSLSVQQTPPALRDVKTTVPIEEKGITWKTIEQVQQMLQQLPNNPLSAPLPETVAPEITRIDHYLAHFKETSAYLPPRLKYWTVDEFYSKKKFVGRC